MSEPIKSGCQLFVSLLDTERDADNPSTFLSSLERR